MKHFLLILLSLTFMFGCKKGEDDPAISFLSRKSRICGEWKMTNATERFNSSTYTYDKGKLTISTYYGGASGTYGWTFSFKKDGTYIIHRNVQITYNGTVTETEEGNWYFLEKNANLDIKSKQVIALQPKSMIYNSNSQTLTGASPYLFEIIELRRNKIHLKRTYDNIENIDNENTTTQNFYDYNLITDQEGY